MFSCVKSSPNSSLLAFQLTSAQKLSFNFKPNQRDCIYSPEDDKPHRGLDFQSHDFIYLVPSWKTDKFAHPKAACVPVLYHSDASVFS